MASIILVSNPGSASRKYAVFDGQKCLASLHFEYDDHANIRCSFVINEKSTVLQTGLERLDKAASVITDVLVGQQVIAHRADIKHVGLRVVAPSSTFLEDQNLGAESVKQLEELAEITPLHVKASLSELKSIHNHLPGAKVIGVSDSHFHRTKPDKAWNYGISLRDADRFDIKRFGYHGISVASVVHNLKQAHKLTPQLVVCHLGSGASISAVKSGYSVDTTMGYTPLEGLIMSTRSGSIDQGAVNSLKRSLKLSDHGIEEYLHHESGLLGLSGSSDDIRVLLQSEKEDHRAALALDTYVYGIQKAIGQMVAALGGIDMLVFTGTVGERSAIIRQRVLEQLAFLDLDLSEEANTVNQYEHGLSLISKPARSKPVFVVKSDEAAEIARHVQTWIKQTYL